MLTMKGAILIAVVAAAVALGACRREQPARLKLGDDLPAATQPAREATDRFQPPWPLAGEVDFQGRGGRFRAFASALLCFWGPEESHAAAAFAVRDARW